MSTFLRAVISLLVTLWVGGLLFFYVVAGVAFSSLPDTHTAGTVVRNCLVVLHWEGLGAGLLLVLLLLAAGARRVFGGPGMRPVMGPLTLTLVMLALTALSQFVIVPPMERIRLGAGGNMDRVARSDSRYVAFNRLHQASVRVEGGALVCGLALVVLLARERRAGAGSALPDSA